MPRFPLLPVVLIEECDDLREVLAELLCEWGLRVHAGAREEEVPEGAWREARLVLAGVNGLSAEGPRAVERLVRRARVPVLALATGDGPPRLPGAAQVVRKPVDESALAALVTRWLPPTPHAA